MESSMSKEKLRELYMRKYEENKESVDARIAEGIETYRKGNCRMQFTDETGKPIAGVKVKITQMSHDFKYGANLFLLDELESPQANEQYRRFFKEHFNLATIPFYWNTLEPEEGNPRFAANSPRIYRRPAPDLCMEYCKENGVTPKLHCLFYDKFAPEWLKGADEETAKDKLEKRIREIAERYSGQMFEFEVTNELFCVHDRQTVLGGCRDIVSWCFETARKYLPQDKLTINENNTLPDTAKLDYYSPYFLMCDGLLKQGVPIDRIGIQNHQFTGVSAQDQESYDKDVLAGLIYNDPEMYFKSLDVMAQLGKPIEITEVTIPTFGYSEEDEELQADMLKLWFSIWFSHPAVDAVVYWNTIDGYTFVSKAWNENNCRGGLWHHDLTPKKAAVMLKKLFGEIWHTEMELVTDAEGYVEFRGFYGEYLAEAGSIRKKFGLHK